MTKTLLLGVVVNFAWQLLVDYGRRGWFWLSLQFLKFILYSMQQIWNGFLPGIGAGSATILLGLLFPSINPIIRLSIVIKTSRDGRQKKNNPKEGARIVSSKKKGAVRLPEAKN
jgi:hypothetical protein